MLFDFRGHGKSKDVIPEKFWKDQWNQQSAAGWNNGKKPIARKTIDKADFKSDYYPALVNDLAAVRETTSISRTTGRRREHPHGVPHRLRLLGAAGVPVPGDGMEPAAD